MSKRSSLWRTAVSVFVQEKHKNVSWYRNVVGTFTVNPHVSGCTTMHKSLGISREDAHKTQMQPIMAHGSLGITCKGA